jgi:hypothetical protein
MKEAELDDGDKKLLSDIEKYGLHVVYVLGDEEGPGFGFSIGLYKNYNHPEIIVVGLKQQITHIIINNIAEDIKGGKLYEPFSWSKDVLENYDCLFIKADKSYYKEYVGYGIWYYDGDDFPLLQCIYPTIKGIYPWQDAWPENIKNSQPILGPINQPNQYE